MYDLDRRTAIILVSFAAFFLLTGCGETDGSNSKSGNNDGVATIQPEVEDDPSGNNEGQSNSGQSTNNGTGNSDDGGGNGSGGGTEVSGPLVDSSCIDGKYSEQLPSKGANISQLVSNYSSDNVQNFVKSVLEKRYSIGHWVVEGGLSSGDTNCIKEFLRDTSGPEKVINQMSTVVHECGHIYDLNQGSFSKSTYKIRPDLTLTCPGGLSKQQNGKTMSRNRIANDKYASKLPPCDRGQQSADCDMYASIYLGGDPGNNQFESGDQGFGSLLEETLQYVNSLATGYAVQDFYRGSRTERDGILTFLWYLQRYLRLARLEHPEVYEFIASNECWQKAILKVWGRAWLYLEASQGTDALGIHADRIKQLATNSDLNGEIQRIRRRAGCSSQ